MDDVHLTPIALPRNQAKKIIAAKLRNDSDELCLAYFLFEQETIGKKDVVRRKTE